MSNELDPKVRAELHALAKLIYRQDEKISALARARQLDVSSIPVTVEDDEGVQSTVDVPLNVGVSQGVRALEVANRVDDGLAEADQKIQDIIDGGVTAQGGTIYPLSFEPPVPPETGFTDKDIWYAANAAGEPVELRSWNGSEWVRLTTLADQVLVYSPDGTISLADGVVTAPKIAVDALTGKTITGGLIQGTTVEGSTLRLPGLSSITPILTLDVTDLENSLTEWSSDVCEAEVTPGYEGATFVLTEDLDGDAVVARTVPTGLSLVTNRTRESSVTFIPHWSGIYSFNLGMPSIEVSEYRVGIPVTVKGNFLAATEDIDFTVTYSYGEGFHSTIREGSSLFSIQRLAIWYELGDQRSAEITRDVDGNPGLRTRDHQGRERVVVSPEGVHLLDVASGNQAVFELGSDTLSIRGKSSSGAYDDSAVDVSIPGLTATPAMITAGVDNSHYVTPAGLSGGGNIGWTNIPLSGGYTGPLEACLINGFVYFRGQINRSPLVTGKIGNLPSQRMFPTGKHRVLNVPSASTDIGKVEVQTGGEIHVAGVPSGRNYLVLDPIAYLV